MVVQSEDGNMVDLLDLVDEDDVCLTEVQETKLLADQVRLASMQVWYLHGFHLNMCSKRIYIKE